jgi:hypothetical protein
VKRTGKGQSTGAVMHICMGTTEGNFLCSHLYLKLTKRHGSHFIFSVFPSTKLANRIVDQILLCVWEGWHQWDGGGGGERGRRMNMYNQCLHMYVNAKMITCLNRFRNEEEEWGKEVEREAQV